MKLIFIAFAALMMVLAWAVAKAQPVPTHPAAPTQTAAPPVSTAPSLEQRAVSATIFDLTQATVNLRARVFALEDEVTSCKQAQAAKPEPAKPEAPRTAP